MHPAVLAAVLAAMSVALAWAPRTGVALLAPVERASERDGGQARARDGALRRHRLLLAGLAAVGGVTFGDGLWGWAAAGGLFALVWVAVDRMEPPGVRREREAVRRGFPQVVGLLAIALDAGASVPSALEQVSLALPGPGSEALRLSRAQLALGVRPEQVWSELGSQPGLEPLGRALARADSSGVPVADAVRRLGADLARQRRLEVEDRARTVGIRAALPLGLCLLPSFLAVGIVPVVVASLGSLRW